MKKGISLFIACILMIIFTTACSMEEIFNGSRTSNDQQFIMEYSIFTGSKTHEIQLEKGTIIDVNIKNTDGNLRVVISDADGEELYRGDNAETGTFSVETLKDSKYKFAVTGKKAKGGVSFKVRKDVDKNVQ
ncbi:MAG: hypothetical protein GX895_13330 [Clostridiales bacterium]|uniref:hypothetical protein n=1 Tax=Clostridium sp. N3C TaxID=1776758 RepID=UPI00092DF8A2|nr:hypothetical protein [Clostridium sp. N3C]NLZ49732.1 hypothetical protein [Clostridiales bacterium]SCN25255.1 hypothetical protein N3C_2235 [Clostridium sp. N3C]